MFIQFVIENWYLFAALVVVVGLLAAGPLAPRLKGIRLLTPSATVLAMNHEQGRVVDVSEPGEYGKGHVPGAVNIPLGALDQRLDEIAKDRARPVILACRSGNRSVTAAVKLKKAGFSNVSSLAGGLMAWERDSLPLER